MVLYTALGRVVDLVARAKGYRPGSHEFLVSVDAELNLDLHAFCQIHYGAPKQEVAREALRKFIADEIARRGDKEAFEVARERLGGPEKKMRLVPREGATGAEG
jgi:hypothetical protein